MLFGEKNGKNIFFLCVMCFSKIKFTTLVKLRFKKNKSKVDLIFYGLVCFSIAHLNVNDHNQDWLLQSKLLELMNVIDIEVKPFVIIKIGLCNIIELNNRFQPLYITLS